jgi:hypothetical protein
MRHPGGLPERDATGLPTTDQGRTAPALIAARDPSAPDPRPDCRHPACWDALAGKCLTGRGFCLTCGRSLDPKLAAAGDTTHANCAEDPAA